MRYTLEEIKDGTGFRPGAQFDEVTDYNGWTNRETWAVALHINNDQGWQESVHEALLAAHSDYAAGQIIKGNVEETLELLWQGSRGAYDYYSSDYGLVREDIGSLWRVDWTELGRVFLSDLDES